jgi:hypothetical protein
MSERRGIGAAISNWRGPLPWYRKLWLAGRNTGIKIARRQDCCGHDGEPGC